MSTDIKSLGSFVWSIAELLRGDFKQSEYGKVILPFVVLRRLDCILEATKKDVINMASSLPADMDHDARDTLLSGVVEIRRSKFAVAARENVRARSVVSIKTGKK